MHLVQLLKVSVINMLENECWGSADWVLNAIDFLTNCVIFLPTLP
jgi:hypothetical protein